MTARRVPVLVVGAGAVAAAVADELGRVGVDGVEVVAARPDDIEGRAVVVCDPAALPEGVEVGPSGLAMTDVEWQTSMPGVFVAGRAAIPSDRPDHVAGEARALARFVLRHLGGGFRMPAVPVALDEPLSWVVPSRVGPLLAPYRDRLVLASSVAVRRPRWRVTQGGDLLWERRWLRGIPAGEPFGLPTKVWIGAIDPKAGPVTVSAG